MRDILKPLQIARKAYHMIYYERAAKSLVFPWAEKRVEEYTNQKVIEELERFGSFQYEGDQTRSFVSKKKIQARINELKQEI